MTAKLSFLLGGLVCAAGVIGAVCIATWRMLPLAMQSKSFPAACQWWLLSFTAVGVLGLIFLLAAACNQQPPPSSNADTDEQTQAARWMLYHRYLAGIGFAILLLSGALFAASGGLFTPTRSASCWISGARMPEIGRSLNTCNASVTRSRL